MTNDSLQKIILDNNNKMVEYMARISAAIEAINENGVLHRKSLDQNTNAIVTMVKANTSLIGFIRWIFVAVILALIVLAGAEKVLKFL